jgi:TetR/AcrR family transcriptional repressor of lmrAB and yxaGH operons
MPAALLSRDEVLDRLLDAFRERGYEGASLAELSAATGLVKASLYHHFPGGKAEMATEVLSHLDKQLADQLFRPLQSSISATKKVAAMLDTIDTFYDGGRKACLLQRLASSVDQTSFRRPLKRAFAVWIDAIEALCVEAGLTPARARARAEDLVVRIEGALIVSAGTVDFKVFERTIAELKKSLLAPA